MGQPQRRTSSPKRKWAQQYKSPRGPVYISLYGPPSALQTSDWWTASLNIYRFERGDTDSGWLSSRRLRARDVTDFKRSWKEFKNDCFTTWGSHSLIATWHAELLVDPPDGLPTPDGWEKTFSDHEGFVFVEVFERELLAASKDWYHTYIHIFRFDQLHDRPTPSWDRTYDLRPVDIYDFEAVFRRFLVWFKEWKKPTAIEQLYSNKNC